MYRRFGGDTRLYILKTQLETLSSFDKVKGIGGIINALNCKHRDAIVEALDIKDSSLLYMLTNPYLKPLRKFEGVCGYQDDQAEVKFASLAIENPCFAAD